MNATVEERLSAGNTALSGRLKEAADYVVANPIDVATRSLRAVSRDSGVSPATFTRLARALEFASYEDLRETMRDSVSRRMRTFSDRVDLLQDGDDPECRRFLDRHASACAENLAALPERIDPQTMNTVVSRLETAREVILLGALGSTGIVEYLAYVASFFADNWTLAGRMGSSLGATIARIGPEDVLFVVTKPPFSSRVVRATREARRRGAFVIVVTDTHTCPALRDASVGLTVPTDSPHFYSSYVATMVLLEAIVGTLAQRYGESARSRIQAVEIACRSLDEVWDG